MNVYTDNILTNTLTLFLRRHGRGASTTVNYLHFADSCKITSLELEDFVFCFVFFLQTNRWIMKRKHCWLVGPFHHLLAVHTPVSNLQYKTKCDVSEELSPNLESIPTDLLRPLL